MAGLEVVRQGHMQLFLMRFHVHFGFGCSLRSKVSGEFLEDLSAVFLHEEADEVGGGVQLQRQRRRELTLPATDRGLQGLAQGIHLAVLTHEELAEGDVGEDVVCLVLAADLLRLLPEVGKLLRQGASGPEVEDILPGQGVIQEGVTDMGEQPTSHMLPEHFFLLWMPRLFVRGLGGTPWTGARPAPIHA